MTGTRGQQWNKSKLNQQRRRASFSGGIATATAHAENRAEKLAPGAGQVCFHALP